MGDNVAYCPRFEEVLWPLAKDGCVVEIAPHERGTPASRQTPTMRSASASVWHMGLSVTTALAPVLDGEADELGGGSWCSWLSPRRRAFPSPASPRRRYRGRPAPYRSPNALRRFGSRFASGHEVDLGPVVEGLGVGSRNALWQVSFVEVELAVYVKLRGSACLCCPRCRCPAGMAAGRPCHTAAHIHPSPMTPALYLVIVDFLSESFAVAPSWRIRRGRGPGRRSPRWKFLPMRYLTSNSTSRTPGVHGQDGVAAVEGDFQFVDIPLAASGRRRA